MNQKIDIDKIIDAAAKTVGEIKYYIGTANLTEEEIDRLMDSQLQAELQAYKIKLGLEIQILLETCPDLSAKDILVKMLSLLPSDIPKPFLSVLTNYILDEWDGKKRRMAA